MIDSYQTVFEDNEILQKDKGSKFIAHLFHVETRIDVDRIISELKKKYYDASHHCTGFKISDTEFHYSDDGEPNNTAGKPIYDVIEGSGLIQILIVVVRYFGGTKLGTGGLIKAYGGAAKEVIETSKIETVILRSQMSFQYDYDDTNTVMHCMNQYDIKINDQTYSDHVHIEIAIKISDLEPFRKQLFDASLGKINLIQS